MKNLCFCLMALFVCALLTVPAAALADETRTVEIHVARNDTLIQLCQKYLQQPEKWQEVARLNRLAQPDRLSPGQRLVIPVQMLKALPLQARVTFLQGTGQLREPAAREWRPLRQGDLVRAGSALRSGPQSSVEVTFEDGTRFVLRENTALSVKAAQQGLLHLLRVLYLEAGKVVARVKAATGRDSRFEIETPSALAAARGTEYRVGIDEQATTRAELLESAIDFSAMGSTVALHQEEGSLARFRQPPLPPRKLLPPPEPLGLQPSYSAAPLGLRFSPVPGAARYRAQLSRDPQGKDAVSEATITPGESFQVDPKADGSYYLIASSIDADGLEGRLSEPRELVLRKEPKKARPAPVLGEPQDAAQLHTTRTAITWEKVPGTERYQLQVAANPQFSAPMIDEKEIAGTSYSTGALTVGGYFVRLRGREHNEDYGDWSAVRSFSVLQLPAPVLRKTINADKGWDFAWDQPEEGISSQLQLAGDPAFAGIVLDRTLAKPELRLDKPLGPGTYYVRVRGIDPQGRAGSFSEVATFQVEKPARFPYEFLGVGAALLMLLL